MVYNDLYYGNWYFLDFLNGRCTELTQQVTTKTAECQTLNTRLAELDAMIAAYVPPPPQSPCVTLLHEVCFLSLEDHQFNMSVPGQAAIESDYQNAVAAIQKMLTPIWRPDAKYAIRLQVSDRSTTAPPPISISTSDSARPVPWDISTPIHRPITWISHMARLRTSTC